MLIYSFGSHTVIYRLSCFCKKRYNLWCVNFSIILLNTDSNEIGL